MYQWSEHIPLITRLLAVIHRNIYFIGEHTLLPVEETEISGTVAVISGLTLGSLGSQLQQITANYGTSDFKCTAVYCTVF